MYLFIFGVLTIIYLDKYSQIHELITKIFFTNQSKSKDLSQQDKYKSTNASLLATYKTNKQQRSLSVGRGMQTHLMETR